MPRGASKEEILTLLKDSLFTSDVRQIHSQQFGMWLEADSQFAASVAEIARAKLAKIAEAKKNEDFRAYGSGQLGASHSKPGWQKLLERATRGHEPGQTERS